MPNPNAAPKQAFTRRKTAVKARRAHRVRHRLGDPTGRLASALDSAAGSYGSLAWLYDKNGNRQSETRNAAVMPYGYLPVGSNRLYQRGSETRSNTPNGNTASISGLATFTYDGYNRLATSVTASETTTYTYNALGQRMKKRNQNGLQTVFHYGTNGELLYERDQAGNTKEYVWLNQRPLARIDNGTAIYYYHVDHLGTPQAMTNQAGTVVWKADYEPFGKATVKVSTVENNLRLPGQYFDRETGLHYNYFRDYEPGTGRYVQSDPIGLEGGMNLYGYVLGNPLYYTDPLGLDVTVSRYPGSGANAFGHLGIGVNSSQTNGLYPAPGASSWDVATGQPVPGIMSPDTKTPLESITIKTTPAQDKSIQDFINNLKKNPGNYDLNDRNCATAVRDALRSGGVNTPKTIYPRTMMRNLQGQSK